MWLEQRIERTFLSPSYAYFTSNNSYTFWDVKAPDDDVISMTFKDIHMESLWDGFTHIYFGDNATDFLLTLSESYSHWTRLTNETGRFEEKYRKFATVSSSAKILMTSWTSRTKFTIISRSLKPRGKNKTEIPHCTP